jgi:hypothetical protein
MCKAGYGSATGSAPCRLCPVGSFSDGRTMEDCSPCPFGFTSRAGARSSQECVAESQPCPIGQIAPPHAESADQCFCLPGYGGERLSMLGRCCSLIGVNQHNGDCSVTLLGHALWQSRGLAAPAMQASSAHVAVAVSSTHHTRRCVSH